MALTSCVSSKKRPDEETKRSRCQGRRLLTIEQKPVWTGPCHACISRVCCPCLGSCNAACASETSAGSSPGPLRVNVSPLQPGQLKGAGTHQVKQEDPTQAAGLVGDLPSKLSLSLSEKTRSVRQSQPEEQGGAHAGCSDGSSREQNNKCTKSTMRLSQA